MYTRQQYLNRECTHSDYYGQFVTPAIRDIVLSRYNKKQLMDSLAQDEHLNSIPLASWDMLGASLEATLTGLGAKMKEAGDYLTLSGIVCVLKTAARQIINE